MPSVLECYILHLVVLISVLQNPLNPAICSILNVGGCSGVIDIDKYGLDMGILLDEFLDVPVRVIRWRRYTWQPVREVG